MKGCADTYRVYDEHAQSRSGEYTSEIPYVSDDGFTEREAEFSLDSKHIEALHDEHRQVHLNLM